MKLHQLIETVWDSVPERRSEKTREIPIAEIEQHLTLGDKRFIHQLETAESEQRYLNHLEQSIESSGMKIPITLERVGHQWRMPEGNHRYIVAKRLNLQTVPVEFV